MTISEKHLASSLRNELKKSGVVNRLTAQLRADFVKKMKRGSLGAALSSSSSMPLTSLDSNKENKPKPLTLEDRAVRSLILDYLKDSSLHHSLSVFAPESGVSESALTSEESLKSLGFSELSPTYKDVISSSEHPTLKRVLGHLASTSFISQANHSTAAHPPSSVPTTSTHYTAAESLVEKLNALQKQHEEAINQTRMQPDKNFEEKMLAFQKECEERLTKQMQRDLDRVRKHDIEMMRLEEQARYRGELQALRMEMKAEYDLRSQKASEVSERKFQNAKLKSQQLEAAQYQARQEVVRELEAVRRRELNNRRELDIRKNALELDEQRLNNIRQSIEGKQAELERMETSMKHKYQKEFEHAKEEAKNTYTAANDAIASQQKTLEHELANVRREREALKKFKQDLTEKHSDVLNNGEGVGDIMMERDSLKVKLAECESQLQAFHVQYEEEHKDDQEHSSASPNAKDATIFGRSRNLSTSSNPMSRSWRDHRNALESELERCERELEETKHLLESERSSVEKLREKERSTFEKAATLEAVANSLKDRLSESEKKLEEAVVEKEAAICDNDAMKSEISEMRHLMAKQQSIVDLSSKRKRTAESKDATREARLERVRQRAREQMKNDTGILTGGEERAETKPADEAASTKIVWDNGRPIAVVWDSKVGGLVLQEPAGRASPAIATAPVPANPEAITKLEARLAQTEIASEKFQVLLQAEREKSRVQMETFSMMTSMMGQQHPQQQQQQQQFEVPYAAAQQPSAAARGASRFDLPPPPPVTKSPEVAISPVAKIHATASSASRQAPSAAATSSTAAPPAAAAANTAKPAGWEREYQDYLVSQEAMEAQQKVAIGRKQESISLARATLAAREREAEEAAKARKREEEERDMIQREEEKAVKALKAREIEEEEERKSREAREEEDRKAREEDEVRNEREEEERQARVKKEEKERKEKEERLKWEKKEEERREQKRQSVEREKAAKEKAAKEEEERRKAKEKEGRAAMVIQSHQRRNSAGSIYRDMLKVKRENMNAEEKAKMERDKKDAVSAMKKKKEDDERRAQLEREHEDARARAAERMRERAREEERERERREEEERERRERRMSEGGGGTDSDQLEVSDGTVESFSDGSNPSYDDW
ncbi:hypothetical protein TrCOL_g10444 [Triparma columacea]|uniref:LisH domain-containing protein n=1 Tax=Triparma columacea TaxID=722753 RepID=A0A9W7L851_9STRA|nr:hypothetical protein TrCOL_g10444 [Triparma columacea]